MNYCIFEGIRECPPILGNLRFICIRKKWNPNKPFGKSTLKRPYFWIQPQEQQTFIRLNLNASLDSWTYANPRTNFVIINAIASYTISSNFKKHTHFSDWLTTPSRPPKDPRCANSPVSFKQKGRPPERVCSYPKLSSATVGEQILAPGNSHQIWDQGWAAVAREEANKISFGSTQPTEVGGSNEGIYPGPCN